MKKTCLLLVLLLTLMPMASLGSGYAETAAGAAEGSGDVLPGVWQVQTGGEALVLLGSGGVFLTALADGNWVSGSWYIQDGQLYTVTADYTDSSPIQIVGNDKLFFYESSDNTLIQLDRVKEAGPDAAVLLGTWEDSASGEAITFYSDGTIAVTVSPSEGEAPIGGFYAVTEDKLWIVTDKVSLPSSFTVSKDTLTLTDLNEKDNAYSFVKKPEYAADTDARLYGTWGGMDTSGSGTSYSELTFIPDGRLYAFTVDAGGEAMFSDIGYYRTREGTVYAGDTPETVYTQYEENPVYTVSDDGLSILLATKAGAYRLAKKSGPLMERVETEASGADPSLPVGTFSGYADGDIWDLTLDAGGTYTLLVLGDESLSGTGAWMLADDGLLMMAGSLGFLQNWQYDPSDGNRLADTSGNGWTLYRQPGPLARDQ